MWGSNRLTYEDKQVTNFTAWSVKELPPSGKEVKLSASFGTLQVAKKGVTKSKPQNPTPHEDIAIVRYFTCVLRRRGSRCSNVKVVRI